MTNKPIKELDIPANSKLLTWSQLEEENRKRSIARKIKRHTLLKGLVILFVAFLLSSLSWLAAAYLYSTQ